MPWRAPAEEADAQFPEEVLGCVSEAVAARLSDYHFLVQDARALKASARHRL